MYIYFDSNGTIKEIVNDVAIRKGSADYNKLYVYIEGNPEIDDIWYFQKFPNGSTSNEVSFINNVVIKSIPYDAKRDMTYFKDFVQYKFYVFTLTSEYLNISGLAIGTIRIAVDNSIFALGELTFNIQANEVKEDNGITQSQYDYLLLAYASRTLNEQTGSDLDALLDDKIEAKATDIIEPIFDDYKSTIDDEVEAQNETIASLMQASPSVFDTASNIQLLQENKGVAVATDTGYIYYWDSSLATPAYVSSGIQYNSLANYVKHNGNQLKDANGNNFYPEIDDELWCFDVTWEAYSISSSNGQPNSTSGRIRTADYVEYKDYLYVYNTDQQRIKLFAYNSSKSYLGTVDWVWGNYKLSDLKATYSSVAYFKMIVQMSEALYSGYDRVKICNLTYLVNQKEKNKSNGYYGEKIVIDNTYNYEEYMTITGAQGGTAISVDTGKFLFDIASDNTVYIYNLDNKNLATTKSLPNAEPPHANCVCFGNEKVNSGEIFPLLYVNRYNAQPYINGVCYVYNISGDLSNFTLLQTITIGFTNDSLWSESGDQRPFGNFIVDTDNSFLYVYTLLDTSKVTRVFKFNLPKLADGSTVTLAKTDVLEYFDLPYYQYIQDCCYYKGKLYITSGFGYSPSYAYIHIINLTSKKEVSTINLCDAFGVGATYEPELIYVLGGKLFMGFGSGKLIKFDF